MAINNPALQAAQPLGNVFGGLRDIELLGLGTTVPGLTEPVSYAFGGGVVAVGGKIAMMPITLGTADFLIHHIHAFTIHVTVLVLLKGVLFARSSRLIPDKGELGFRFPCDGTGAGRHLPGFRPGTTSFLGLFWMYNSLSIVIFPLFLEDAVGCVGHRQLRRGDFPHHRGQFRPVVHYQ